MSDQDTATSGSRSVNESKIEQLLSEKLMEGYVLLESSCPVCSTPLVKNEISSKDGRKESSKMPKPVILSSNSFDKPFKPVDGVPICIVCRSHVVTHESEISILERCDSLKDKGSILLALYDSSSGSTGDVEISSKYTTDGSAPVVISVESQETDGEENIVEISPSPREGRVEKPIFVRDSDEEQDWIPMSDGEPAVKAGSKTSFDDTTIQNQPTIQSKTDINDVMQEYSVRREIATKVLGAKMLQGYVLKETTCDRCGMPLMEHRGNVTCVVCPALAKKAKKKMKVQEQKKSQEKSFIQQEIDANRALEWRMREEQLEADRREKEERLQKFREDELERERLAKRQMAVEEEKKRLLEMEREEEARLRDLEEEEIRILLEAQERAAENARREEEARLQSLAKQQQENHRLATLQLETEAMLAAQYAAETVKEKQEANALLDEKRKQEKSTLHLQRAALFAEKLAAEKAKQKEEEQALLEETRRLEHLETQTLSNKSEYMQRDLLEQQHNARLQQKALLDEEITRLEEARRIEELEVRRLAEEQRAEDEARMIAALEADAAAKALAAEDAIKKAKQALEAVNTTKREIIAQTIALAEREAIAETERELKAELEDYKERVILPTESQLYRERWETLRLEGRAIMTRRVLQGWELLPLACRGAECEMSPLITKHGRRECVVCGGTGTGEDGVYAIDETAEDEDLPFDVTTIDPELLPENASMTLSKYSQEGALSYTPHDDFEEKRDMVSKEIGKRMLMGWTLLDASCPTCVMPLMMDDSGNKDICVLCGPLEPTFDASTIKTKDMDYAIDKAFSIEEEEKKKDISPNATLQSEPPAVPTKASPPTSENNDLLLAIKQRADAHRIGDHCDPPAHTKGISKSMYSLADSDDSEDGRPRGNNNDAPKTLKAEPEEVREVETVPVDEEEDDDDDGERVTLTIPKNFDLSDPEALKDLIKANRKSEDEVHDTIEVTKSGAIYTAKDAMSTEMIAKMFLRSPQGYDFQDIGMEMSVEEVKELVDIFMVTNFNEPVPDDFKYEVARDILEKLQPEVECVVEPAVLFDPEPVYTQPSTTPTSGVINLEHLGSPLSQEHLGFTNRAFHFDDYVETRSVKSSRRSKPTPETLMAQRQKPAPGKSPRPPRAGGNSRRDGAPLIVGGPLAGGTSARHYRNDSRSIGGMSRAESVASDALESIYIRIDQCKAKLMDPNHTMEEQLATADLLEKLAKAAVAIKAMETIEQNE
ncbi:hypothetical protein IV203_022434 [Nitzschia inconspicua]|uniref:Uncharacterized protein n=1 Tax=Nitzschia inconspicua TaxID=303405 RepID=A0A9K3PAK5_9STRA|nr:hypothetical protein IV203_024593 [Nitzschia inconspicua]KAG7344426.1 hypothetical protein IV203_022434 [Nitzschia inconspicua]